jgi:hypothetical protein
MANKKRAAAAAAKEEWPMDGATVQLAKGATPPTVSGVVNVGMEHSIHLPSLELQTEGFTPYIVRANRRDDATRELLTQFPGRYKMITEKGGSDD